MENYRATPEQWDALEKCSHAWPGAWGPCILELRARIEALEARQRPASKVYEISKPLQLTPEQAQQIGDLLAPNSKRTPNSSQIRSSLVERVALAISRCEDSSAWDDEAVNWAPEARAAIREVAAWMTSNPDVYFPPALVFALEQEAE